MRAIPFHRICHQAVTPMMEEWTRNDETSDPNSGRQLDDGSPVSRMADGRASDRETLGGRTWNVVRGRTNEKATALVFQYITIAKEANQAVESVGHPRQW